MRKVIFTEEQMKDLATFLNRVPLTGTVEAAQLLSIGEALNKEFFDKIKINKVDKIDKIDKKLTKKDG